VCTAVHNGGAFTDGFNRSQPTAVRTFIAHSQYPNAQCSLGAIYSRSKSMGPQPSTHFLTSHKGGEVTQGWATGPATGRALPPPPHTHTEISLPHSYPRTLIQKSATHEHKALQTLVVFACPTLSPGGGMACPFWRPPSAIPWTASAGRLQHPGTPDMHCTPHTHALAPGAAPVTRQCGRALPPAVGGRSGAPQPPTPRGVGCGG
jgi:hypothetical protein